MLAISSGVAERSAASSPISNRRRGVCGIIVPTFTALGIDASVSMYSGKVSNEKSTPASRALRDIPSTDSRVSRIVWCISRRVGATPKPQLPSTTLVTPCHEDGVRSRSHNTWAS